MDPDLREALVGPWRWKNIKRLLKLYAMAAIVGAVIGFVVLSIQAWWRA
jgi:hypothetical protein